ncbi:MAG: hypothetical protein ACXVBE_07835 [Bdellovibrionota bacterium]
MRSISLLVLFVLFFSPPAKADEFRLKSGDKQTHMLAGYGLSLTGTLFLEKKVGLSRTQSVLYASLFTMLVGTAKEFLIDDKYSAGDQWGNLIGTAGSAAMVFTFEF